MTRASRGLLLRTLAVSTLIVVLAGCGEDTPPSVAAPELGTSLSKVDSALASQDYPRAERALDQLAATAVEAERAGEISDADADRIVAAVSNLLAQLPEDGDVAPEDTPTPAPTETASPPDDEGEKDDREDKDKDEDKDEDKNKDSDG